jgi:hypothetical protein
VTHGPPPTPLVTNTAHCPRPTTSLEHGRLGEPADGPGQRDETTRRRAKGRWAGGWTRGRRGVERVRPLRAWPPGLVWGGGTMAWAILADTGSKLRRHLRVEPSYRAGVLCASCTGTRHVRHRRVLRTNRCCWLSADPPSRDQAQYCRTCAVRYLTVSVGFLWLACTCTWSRGAVGKRVSHHARSMRLPRHRTRPRGSRAHSI